MARILVQRDSGKTYTMLFLSRMIALRDPDAFNNPTIVIIVDREDLDTQTAVTICNSEKRTVHEDDCEVVLNLRADPC